MDKDQLIALATLLESTLATYGIDLGYGRPTVVGTVRQGTLRVELYLDPDMTAKLIQVLQTLR